MSRPRIVDVPLYLVLRESPYLDIVREGHSQCPQTKELSIVPDDTLPARHIASAARKSERGRPEGRIVELEQKARIIIVEDDASMRSSLEFLLNAWGYSVISYATPEEFLPHIDGLAADCVILDVHLPGMTGLDLYKLVQQYRTGLPVIFISGHVDEATRTEVQSLTAIAILEKPFADHVLRVALERTTSG